MGRGSWPSASLAESLLSPAAQARPASRPHGRGPPAASVVPGLSWSGCLPESGLGKVGSPSSSVAAFLGGRLGRQVGREVSRGVDGGLDGTGPGCCPER